MAVAACGSQPPAQPPGSSTTSSTTAPVGPQSVLHDDFSSGGLTAGRWTAENATVVTTGPTPPGPYAQLRAENGPAYLLWDRDIVVHGRRYWAFRGAFRVESRAAGQSIGLATVKNDAGQHHADLFVDAGTGHCRIDLYSEDTATTPIRCDDGAWHTVVMRGDYGSSTYTMEWELDGSPQPAIASTGQPPSTARSLWLGDSTPGKTNVINWTSITLAVSTTSLPFPTP